MSFVLIIGDEELIKWEKNPVAAIPFPPKSLPLTGWRDPFVLPRGPTDDSWTMLMGSGIKGQGGAVMIYKSTNLTSGWFTWISLHPCLACICTSICATTLTLDIVQVDALCNVPHMQS